VQSRSSEPLPPGYGSRASASGSRLLTAAEVAQLLGVPPSWVYEQSRAGRIPTVTLGRYRRYRREAIEAWLIELEQVAAARSPGRLAR
jgi:excisionase family DNA binding protein